MQVRNYMTGAAAVTHPDEPVVAAARPILTERRTGIAEGAAVVARLALATRAVVVRPGRAVVI